MANYHPPGIAEEVGCTSSNTQWAFPTSLEETRCRPHWRDLTSMFMTIQTHSVIHSSSGPSL